MKRSQILLAALAAVLVIAVFYVLLFQPTREELAAIEVEVVAEQDEQVALTQEIARLQAVREQAPETEAELVAAEAIVPRDPALPAALRQLQLAADESGLVLQAVNTARPAALGDATDGLSTVNVDIQMVGEYFQVVDFLRRVEDPEIMPRGLTWSTASVARAADYPDLTVSLVGSLYAAIAVPPPVSEAAAENDTAAEDDTDDENADGDDADGDDAEGVDVEVEVS